MTLKKKIGLALVLIVLILIVQTKTRQSKEAVLRVGVSDDTSTLVVNHMMERQKSIELDPKEFIQKYTISDC